MKLSKLAHLVLRNTEIKQKVCEAAGITINALYYWIKTENIRLTSLVVLETISKETGLSIEQLVEVDDKISIPVA